MRTSIPSSAKCTQWDAQAESRREGEIVSKQEYVLQLAELKKVMKTQPPAAFPSRKLTSVSAQWTSTRHCAACVDMLITSIPPSWVPVQVGQAPAPVMPPPVSGIRATTQTSLLLKSLPQSVCRVLSNICQLSVVSVL